MTWEALDALAGALSEAGHLVTQIHHTGQAPGEWCWRDFTAAVHSGAESDFVVTSDGSKHTP